MSTTITLIHHILNTYIVDRERLREINEYGNKWNVSHTVKWFGITFSECVNIRLVLYSIIIV